MLKLIFLFFLFFLLINCFSQQVLSISDTSNLNKDPKTLMWEKIRSESVLNDTTKVLKNHSDSYTDPKTLMWEKIRSESVTNNQDSAKVISSEEIKIIEQKKIQDLKEQNEK